MAWTDSDIKKLKQLCEKGLSTVAIGQQLGISKNAVIGKVHRLQLQARPSPIRVAAKPQAVRKGATPKKVVKASAKKAVKPVVKTTRKPVAKTTAKKTAPVVKKTKDPVAKKAPVISVKKTQSPKKAPVSKKAEPVVKAAPTKAPDKKEKARSSAKNTQKKSVLIPQSRRELFTKHTSQAKEKGIPLTELKATSCRWPLGDPNDPDFSFCGKEAVPGKPYCATHCLEAYTGVFKPR